MSRCSPPGERRAPVEWKPPSTGWTACERRLPEGTGSHGGRGPVLGDRKGLNAEEGDAEDGGEGGLFAARPETGRNADCPPFEMDTRCGERGGAALEGGIKFRGPLVIKPFTGPASFCGTHVAPAKSLPKASLGTASGA